MSTNTEIDDGLTEEERAMLSDEDEGTDTDTDTGGDDAADDQNDNDEGGDAGAGDDAGAGADDDAGAAPGRDDGEDGGDDAGEPEGQAGEGTQNAPILVAEAPADADAKLKEIADQKADLRKKYDDGDLTFEEYEAQADKLDEQRLELKLALKEAETAAKMEQQRARNEFLALANEFTHKTYPQYAQNQEIYQKLDENVRFLAAHPSTAGLTGKQVLEKAHKLVMIDHPELFPAQPPKTAKKQAQPEKELPPSLHNLPAADTNDVSGGKWAALDRLMNQNPIAYEEALAKMSDADRDAYLASA